MATISTLYKTGATHQSKMNGPVPTVNVNYINLADAVTAKGSALAQADVIQALHVPAGSIVLFAGIEVISAMTGTSTDATIDFGVTGGDVDCWVDGFDLDAGTAGAYAAAAAAAITPAQTFFAAADTLDLLIVTQTGTITGGVLRVFAVLLDVSDAEPRAQIVQLGT